MLQSIEVKAPIGSQHHTPFLSIVRVVAFTGQNLLLTQDILVEEAFAVRYMFDLVLEGEHPQLHVLLVACVQVGRKDVQVIVMV